MVIFNLDPRNNLMERMYMEQAMDLASNALKENEVPVGCVIVFGTDVISSGSNKTNESGNPTLHAEVVAIKNYEQTHSDLSVLQKSELYVTVEPCVMCANILSLCKFKRVIYGCPNPKFGGMGSVFPAPSGLTFVSGIMSSDSVLLLRLFYLQENMSAPNPKKKACRKLNIDDKLVNIDVADQCLDSSNMKNIKNLYVIKDSWVGSLLDIHLTKL